MRAKKGETVDQAQRTRMRHNGE